MNKEQSKKYTIWAVVNRNNELITILMDRKRAKDCARIMNGEDITTEKKSQFYKVKKVTLII